MTEIDYYLNPQNCANRLTEIARQAYQPYVAVIGKEPAPMVADYGAHLADDTVITASLDDKIIGFAVLIDKPDGLWLETIAVADGYRGQGIGTALLAYTQTHIREKADSYQLYTNEKMIANKDWYLRLGFTITAIKEQAGFRRIFFKKVL